jgi:ADP-ribosylglycohydrolase
LGGDTDTKTCIVGGLLGALNGLHGLPEVMVNGLLNCGTSLGQPRHEFYSTRHLLLLIDILVEN